MGSNHYCDDQIELLTRRDALRTIAAGFGYLAFAGLASADVPGPLSPKRPPLRASAKRVIFLCMRGGPSHVDTFDYKPRLLESHGQDALHAGTSLCASPWKFRQHGDSGLWVSDLFPHVGRLADELCLLRGMHCDQPSHAQAFVQMHTGASRFVRPSMGAWSLYGLGSQNENLPGYISINPPSDLGGAQNYGNAFLPAAYQGTRFQIADSSRRNRPIDRRRRGEVNSDGLDHLRNDRLTSAEQEAQLDLIRQMNQAKVKRDRYNPQVEGVIESFELAFRMQTSVPDLMDLENENPSTRRLYGIGEDPTDGFGRQCLLARRFAEAGVRFIELGHGSWDQHANMQTSLAQNAAETDKPIAGLLTDLKQRGLLDDTLVIWGGEFGRTPHSTNGDGRDHNHKGYTTWMAGGGVKPGFSYGSTDELGYEAVDGIVHIHDWHATILRLLGLDHENLTFLHGGREMRLTDVAGNVVDNILA